MIQMVKVLEAERPGRGYLAEVPGRPGQYVKASDLSELRRKLRAALVEPDETSFAMNAAPRPMGYSETALFVRI